MEIRAIVKNLSKMNKIKILEIPSKMFAISSEMFENSSKKNVTSSKNFEIISFEFFEQNA